MLRLSSVLLPCVFLLASVPAASAGTDDEPMFHYFSGPCRDLPRDQYYYCRALEVVRTKPCTGSVEERLICLDNKVGTQEREIARLKRELERRSTPRIHPLDERRLSQQ